jgi:hypothetical protein
MNAAVRSIVEEARWVVAILACLLVSVVGMGAGWLVAAILRFGTLGTDHDGPFNFFLFGPIGALTGFGIGLAIGSRFIEWARDSEAHR